MSDVLQFTGEIVMDKLRVMTRDSPDSEWETICQLDFAPGTHVDVLAKVAAYSSSCGRESRVDIVELPVAYDPCNWDILRKAAPAMWKPKEEPTMTPKERAQIEKSRQLGMTCCTAAYVKHLREKAMVPRKSLGPDAIEVIIRSLENVVMDLEELPTSSWSSVKYIAMVDDALANLKTIILACKEEPQVVPTGTTRMHHIDVWDGEHGWVEAYRYPETSGGDASAVYSVQAQLEAFGDTTRIRVDEEPLS